jgi:hypothetical protein
MKIPTANPEIVSTSCALLKFLFRMSKVLDGATRVRNTSSPYAKTSEVDSRRAGDVMMFRVWATWIE